jgi:hypothetical protein
MESTKLVQKLTDIETTTLKTVVMWRERRELRGAMRKATADLNKEKGKLQAEIRNKERLWEKKGLDTRKDILEARKNLKPLNESLKTARLPYQPKISTLTDGINTAMDNDIPAQFLARGIELKLPEEKATQ